MSRSGGGGRDGHPENNSGRTLVGASLAGVMVLPIPALAGIGLLGVTSGAHAIALVVIVLLLVRESPASRATTLALNTVALSLGQALGAMLGGVLLGISDFPLLGMSALAFSVTAALLIGVIRVGPTSVPATPQVQPAT